MLENGKVRYNGQTYIIQRVEEVPFFDDFEDLAEFLTQSVTYQAFIGSKPTPTYETEIQIDNVRIQTLRSVSSQTQSDVSSGGFLMMLIPGITTGIGISKNTHLEVVFK
jgi:hypothetical protein